MSLIAELLFWFSAMAILYVYVGYPLLLVILSMFRSRPVRKSEFKPSVTIIITAYNEGRDLAAKLENTLLLDYDKDLLEIIVASDCSTDLTDQIAISFAPRGVRLHRQPQRLGKTAAQNAAIETACGEVVLFSDATTLYRPDVLKAIVPSFADPTVGCVAGRLEYVNPSRSNTGQGARSYWGYELFLKRQESRVCSLIGVSGCLYAVRRSAYVAMYNEACSDFLIATKMMEQGLRTVYEPEAVCFEQTNQVPKRELQMRVRVITQTYTDLWRHRSIMNPFRGGLYSVELFSHKVMRYCVPFLLTTLVLSSAFLARDSILHFGFLAFALIFAVLAFVGWQLEAAKIRNRVLTLPYYFVLANLASVIALYKLLKGERYARWEPIRDRVGSPQGSASVSITAKPEGSGK